MPGGSRSASLLHHLRLRYHNPVPRSRLAVLLHLGYGGLAFGAPSFLIRQLSPGILAPGPPNWRFPTIEGQQNQFVCFRSSGQADSLKPALPATCAMLLSTSAPPAYREFG